ncbi:retrovirus-related pol polyprotein from transposon TNT 1-94 [Tanacetum coccineum]
MCKTTKEIWHTLIITHQGNSQVKNCKINLFTQDYEKFSISNEETIDVDFTRFNAIMTCLKSLDPDYSSKNHVRKFLLTQPLKWKAKVTAIGESKDLATLPLDELIGNLKVYEMVLDNDGVASKTTKEKVKSLALKPKITREQTSDDSDCQGESDEDVYEEEAEEFNMMARNFHKFFHKGIRFERGNRFGNCANRFGKSRRNSFGNKGGENSKQNRVCYNFGIEGHFASECTKPNENKAFVEKAWSDSEDGDEPLNNATCLMAIDSQELQTKPSTYNNDSNIVDLQKENEELLRCQKLSQDKEGLGFSKNDKTTSAGSQEPITTMEVRHHSGSHNGLRYMIKNRTLFTSYKAYDGGHVVFGSNLKGKVVGGGNITRDSITITNVEQVSGLAFNLISIVYLTKFDPNSYKGVFLGYSQTSKAYIVLNKETIRIEESLNVTFDESLPEPKSSPSIEMIGSMNP